MTAQFSVGQVSHQWAKELNIDSWYAAQTTSTNEIAKKVAFSEAVEIHPLATYFSDHQSQGRGRGVNSWKDNGEGSYLLSSWSFDLESPPQPILATRLGLAVFTALDSTWNSLNWSLKAPNDIFVNDKKVAGLLIENLQEGQRNRLILGLGMNVFAHPGLAQSTCLAENIKNSQHLTITEWKEFLDRLNHEFTISIRRNPFALSANECENLLWALNKMPLKSAPYLMVEPSGNLVTASGRISWKEL